MNLKCPHCGGDMPLEALTCPYCGRPNEAAQQHARDMLRYRADYEKTKTAVTEKARRSSAVLVRLVIIVLLMLGILASLIVAGNSYSFVREAQRKDAVKHAAEYKAVLDDYLEEREYAAFAAFIQAKAISVYDDYEEYNYLYRVCSQYRYTEMYLMQLATPGRYQSYSRTVRNVTEQVQDFYELLQEEGSSWRDDGRDSEKAREAVAGMRL